MESADIESLCRDLADAMVNPNYGPHLLRRQTQLLDHLLYAVMNKQVKAALERGEVSDHWIELVLKIQRQCMDTVKTGSAVEYMRAIQSQMQRSGQLHGPVLPAGVPLPPGTGGTK